MVNKLEEIIEKGKKIAKTGLLGFAIGFGNYLGVSEARAQTQGNDIEQGKVVVSLKCVDEQTGEETRELVLGRNYQLQVIGDNRGLNGEQSIEFVWEKVSIQNKLNILDIEQPNPKYKSDFFEGEEFTMSRLNNYIGINRSDRATRVKNWPDGVYAKGPTNRMGVLGIYKISPSANVTGQAKFSIGYIAAKGKNLPAEQDIKIKNLSAAIVSNPKTNPVLVMDRDWENERDNFYVAEADGKASILQYAEDVNFTNSVNFYTNKIRGKSFETSFPFDEKNRFYRAVNID
mgnify:CR=1 FL=1